MQNNWLFNLRDNCTPKSLHPEPLDPHRHWDASPAEVAYWPTVSSCGFAFTNGIDRYRRITTCRLTTAASRHAIKNRIKQAELCKSKAQSPSQPHSSRTRKPNLHHVHHAGDREYVAIQVCGARVHDLLELPRSSPNRDGIRHSTTPPCSQGYATEPGCHVPPEVPTERAGFLSRRPFRNPDGVALGAQCCGSGQGSFVQLPSAIKISPRLASTAFA